MKPKFTVYYSVAHETARTLGSVDDFVDALVIARRFGAIGDGVSTGPYSRVYDVRGHAGDETFGIWIEESRE